MAINKNFVIKNGVEVNSNLIVGDSDTNRVGVGTTVPEYTLHVAGPNGIGATYLNVVGVGTVQNLRVVGVTTLTGDVTASGIVSANQFQVGVNTVVTSSRELQNITALDSTTTETIEQAIRVGPNSFSDLKVAGISTFVGVATFLGGIDVNLRSGVSTFSAPVQFGMGPIDGQVGLSSNYVAVGATVGFGTTAYFRDNAAIFMGDSSELKIHHDGTHGWIRNVGGDFHIQPADGEEGIVAIGNSGIHLFYDDARKLHTTSGGIGVTGISTFTGRINVQTGVSTFQDSAKLTFGHQSDLIIWHDGSHSYIQDTTGTGNLYVDSNSLQIRNAAGNETQAVFTENGSVDLYFDNSKKVETTSGGLKVTGITTLTDRLHVQAGVSTFDADVRYGIGATVGFGTSAFFKDDAAIWLGDDSDLEVVHTGGVSKVKAADLRFQTPSDEEYIKCIENAGVSVYYDNSKKLESTSGGLNITGITTFSDRINVLSGVSTFADSASLTFGTQGDLSIVHNGSNSIIKDSGTGALWIQSDAFAIQNAAGTESGLVFTENGSVDIYFDNSKKVETTSGGLNVTGITTFSDRINVVSGVSTFQDSASLTFGAQGDLSIVHNGSNSIIKENGTGALWIQGDAIAIQNAAGSETQAVFTADSSVDLYYDATKTFETTPQGINVSGVTTTNRLYVSGITTFLDDAVVNFGNSNDLSISHNGSNSIIKENGTGALWIQGDAIAIQNAAGSETQAVFTADGSVDLYHNNIKRFETTDDGILVGSLSTIQSNGNASFAGIVTVGGNLNVTGDIVYDEVSGRNINITGITTLGSGNGGSSGLLVTGAGYVGGGATVGSHSGIITYYGDGSNLTGASVGLGTSGGLVGYGITFFEFRGAGFTTAYFNNNGTGIVTCYFQGGGGVGAAGTWVPYGESGIATSKAVGVGTVGMAVTSLQGGQKGASSGIGNSFHGLYIGNGMMVVDNTLNGSHYIGTAYNGLMAGPVTINGVLTVDGNYVVV